MLKIADALDDVHWCGRAAHRPWRSHRSRVPQAPLDGQGACLRPDRCARRPKVDLVRARARPPSARARSGAKGARSRPTAHAHGGARWTSSVFCMMRMAPHDAEYDAAAHLDSAHLAGGVHDAPRRNSSSAPKRRQPRRRRHEYAGLRDEPPRRTPSSGTVCCRLGRIGCGIGPTREACPPPDRAPTPRRCRPRGRPCSTNRPPRPEGRCPQNLCGRGAIARRWQQENPHYVKMRGQRHYEGWRHCANRPQLLTLSAQHPAGRHYISPMRFRPTCSRKFSAGRTSSSWWAGG